MKMVSLWLRLGIYVCFSSVPVVASDSLEHLRSMTEEWVALEQSLSSEAIAWEERETLLNDLIALAKLEIDRLEAENASLKLAAANADRFRAELVEQQLAWNDYSKTIRKFLIEMESEVKGLIPNLPRPLEMKLAPLLQRLPKDSDNTSIGIAERMQTLATIMSTIHRFNNTLLVSQEIKALPDGSQGEVTTLYLGLGAGYYVTTAGNDAGYGYPAKNGWVWISDPALMGAVSEAIAIAENKTQKARFIQLPISIVNK